MTLKMTTAQVVETSVTVTNSSFQNYTYPDDHTTQTTGTPGFKPFTTDIVIFHALENRTETLKARLHVKRGGTAGVEMSTGSIKICPFIRASFVREQIKNGTVLRKSRNG